MVVVTRVLQAVALPASTAATQHSQTRLPVFKEEVLTHRGTTGLFTMEQPVDSNVRYRETATNLQPGLAGFQE